MHVRVQSATELRRTLRRCLERLLTNAHPVSCADAAFGIPGYGSDQASLLEATFPLDRVRGNDGKIIYSLVTSAGAYRSVPDEDLTDLDLPYGTCVWMESRGGAPDDAPDLELYATCDPTVIVDGLCAPE